MLGTQEQRTEGMKKQAQELIEQAYNRGFKAGYEACKEPKEDLIKKGRKEAWEAAGKLVSMDYEECNEVLSDCVVTIETVNEIFIRCSASEAIDKLRDYEAQKREEEQEIRVGDEVYLCDPMDTRVVIRIFEFNEVTKAALITSDGKWEVDYIHALNKTGRHFHEIENVLEKLQEGNNG